ncbi:hypothetical protein FRC11_009300 [Ceratobasidium sp. 423]|nr:hypothetical protein FRC11_009300 [Ceratobasidium sp. 423]
MAKDDLRSLPSIKVRTGEPEWNCKCKPEVRCRVIVEIPPPKHPRVLWIIRRPTQPNAEPAQVENPSGGGSSDATPTGESTKNTTATSGAMPPTQSNQPSRQVSLPPIETLPDEVYEPYDGEHEWEPEEEVDELEDE